MSENKKENIDTESKHVAPDCECNDKDCACDNSECKTDGTEEKSAEQLLEEKLGKAEKELADIKDQYLRKAAEFENYRKRTLKEKGELATYGAENAVKAILPVLDDFERAMADKMQRLENIKIRGHFDYDSITQLSTEARQKLTSIDPETLAQASRIPGVSPSDISVLLVLMGR